MQLLYLFAQLFAAFQLPDFSSFLAFSSCREGREHVCGAVDERNLTSENLELENCGWKILEVEVEVEDCGNLGKIGI